MKKSLWKYRFKQPPPTLLVLYQGQSVAEIEQVSGGYVFRYLPAFKQLNLSPFPGLTPNKGDLLFYELPTYFEERLPDMKRPEIRDWIRQNQISEDSKLQLLALLGSHTITDPFEFRLKAVA